MASTKFKRKQNCLKLHLFQLDTEKSLSYSSRIFYLAFAYKESPNTNLPVFP